MPPFVRSTLSLSLSPQFSSPSYGGHGRVTRSTLTAPFSLLPSNRSQIASGGGSKVERVEESTGRGKGSVPSCFNLPPSQLPRVKLTLPLPPLPSYPLHRKNKVICEGGKRRRQRGNKGKKREHEVPDFPFPSARGEGSSFLLEFWSLESSIEVAKE